MERENLKPADLDAASRCRDDTALTIEVRLPEPMDLVASLECGQVFRWRRCAFPGRPDLKVAYKGVAGGTGLIIAQPDARTGAAISDSLWVQYDPSVTSTEEVRGIILRYFSYDDHVSSIEAKLKSTGHVMVDAVSFCRGLRIITQDRWEALASYILSTNNSIPNISRIIRNLSERFGEPCGLGERSFPTPERIAGESLSRLRECKCGFRDQNLSDAAIKVSSGDVDLEAIGSMTPEEARRELMRIRGVGPKVADCVLLFGYHMLEVFPVDVWVARAVSRYYLGGRQVSPREAREEGLRRFGRLAGYAQEYLFYYLRSQGLS